MYCPECGTENSRGQKFCTRCGTSLLAVEYARSIVNELATGKSQTNDLSASHVLKITALISVLGLFLITLGTIFLSLIYDHRPGPPVGLMFGISGLITLVLIVRRMLRLIDRAEKPPATAIPFPVTTNPLQSAPHRPLTEGTPPYYSVTDERTRQLEQQ